MREWLNPWNPFNSAKVLLWREHLEACAREDYLPPVSIDIDPANACNYQCKFCNAQDVMGGDVMTEKHMLDLADFFAAWGVKSGCCAGGGEPLIAGGTIGYLERMKHHGLENGLITNGSLITDRMYGVLCNSCRWIGISIDAGTAETYSAIKGCNPEMFYDVMRKAQELIRFNRENEYHAEITYKYLLMPENADEIYAAAYQARDMGFTAFHLRPVGWDNITATAGMQISYTSEKIDEINRQIDAAIQLSNKHFTFYGVRHKFNADFSRKVNFKRCWAIPMIPTFSADGNVYLCFDMRGKHPMTRHDPDAGEILRYWNTDAHRALVRSIDPQKCPRCTFGAHNEIVEQVIINDSMCGNFP